MKILMYFFGTAFRSIWQEKWIHLLTILSISIGLSILCSFLLITFNVDSFMQRWSSSFGLVVYLDKEISEDKIQEIDAYFHQDMEISNIKFVSNIEALDEVRTSLGSNAVILEDLNVNPLPSTFELQLGNGLIDPKLVKQKAESIKQLTGVNDVQYGEEWLASLKTVSDTMKMVAIFFACAILISTIFTTYNTIKIFFYRRKDELKTLKLLGATNTFARTPFLIEGSFVGIAGGTVSAVLVFALTSFTTTRIIEFMPSVSVVLSPLPFQVYLVIPLVGAFISILGSFIAVGRIRY